MTRSEIKLKKKENLDKIELLARENIKLDREYCLLSDEEQWFIEEIESHPKSKY